MERTGLLHLYYGDGKGKTTAAMGLALRALGGGKKVVILQFLKGGQSGEIPLLEQLGAKIYRVSPGTVFLLAVMCTLSRRASSSLPVHSSSRRSMSIR